jgi:alpha-L-rhamnosidase
MTVLPAKLGKILPLLLCVVSTAFAADAGDALRHGFAQPPAAARPRVWWHWMNGNITKEGIQKDLEWMHRVGIGGFQNFDAALGTPQVVDKRLVYMTPEWKDAFLFTTTLADKLGLEEAIAGSPGWSESGGPWVSPAQAMKKVVWSETALEGGQAFSGPLPKPPDGSGPYQSSPFIDDLAAEGVKAPHYYADSVVLAYRIPQAELAAQAAMVSASSGTIDAALLSDGDLAHAAPLPIAPLGQTAWIQFAYANPQTVRAVTFARSDRAPLQQFMGGPPGPELQASDDGVNFRTLTTLPNDGADAQHTIAIPPITARYFRAVFSTHPPAPMGFGDFDFASAGFKIPPPATAYQISELVLHAGARVNRYEEKAGFGLLPDLAPDATPATAADLAVQKDEVLDVSRYMRPDGSFNWTPPAGHWMVLRMGYAPTGVTNHPASPEGTGLEVDKLSAINVRDYMSKYLDNYKRAVGPLMGKRGLQYVISDSWEAGAANWTEDLLAQFRRRRGYDPLPWLPVLTGRVVGTAQASDRFLWDYRRTLGELLVENHYDQITALLKARGMGHYGESHESGRAFIGDGMEAKRSNDVPMAAMWTQVPGVNNDQPGYNADIRESASVAHIYGQNLVAAESMTAAAAPWAWSPETLKPTADKELAMGLNRFVIHTSVHQPLIDKGPGLGLGPFGQWFTRNETWAEQAKSWVDYLARSSFMLQQGHFVADVAWFYGEDSNITALYGKVAPPVPPGYNFDYVNADVLLHRLHVQGGALVSASGMRYRVLALDARSVHMSLPVLRRIRDLIAAGATVCGPRPIDTPSLADDVNEFRSVVDAVWGALDGVHLYGKGKVYVNRTLAETLTALRIDPDVEYSKPDKDTELLAVHRRLGSGPGHGDIYFIDSRVARAQNVEVSLRITGRAPELWHADTGLIEPAAYRINEGRTVVPLQLEPWGAVFVVLRKPAVAQQRESPATSATSLLTLSGPWTLSFQPDRGAPESLQVPELRSWSEFTEPGVRYFSGSASYARDLQAPESWFTHRTRLWLDLGNVKNIAEVSLNGKPLGTLWKSPFRVEVTGTLRPGANTLVVKVTNLWVNRLIGDRQADAARQYTFTVPKFYKADSPLLPSGLLGPVSLIGETTP